jgi:acetate---CoA ligase (ADP-forming)
MTQTLSSSVAAAAGNDAAERCTALLQPRSIALVGASDRQGPGQRVLSNLMTVGFTGGLYLINPKRATVSGRRTYPALSALPDSPDLVVAAVNREAAVEAMAEAAQIESKAGLLLGAGFGESDERGRELDHQLKGVTGGMALMGPNCLGFVNLEDRVAPYSGPLMEQAECGNVALISNSGALACTLTGIAAERNIRFSHVITTGNQMDLSVEDYINYMATRPPVRVIACYVEGFQDGRRLLEALETAQAAEKMVVLLKAGRTKLGGEAALTHTGAVAGSDIVQQSLWRSSGVLIANDLEEFSALIQLCSLSRKPAGPNLGVITISGGERLLLADFAERMNLPLARLGQDTRRELAEVLPVFGSASNPLDTTGMGLVEGDGTGHATASRILANDPEVDVIVICEDAKNGWVQARQESDLFVDGIAATWEAVSDLGKPVVVLTPSTGQLDERARRFLKDHGLPLLIGLQPGMSALAQFIHRQFGAQPPALAGAARYPAAKNSKSTTGYDAMQRLKRAGADVWATEMAGSEEEAVLAASMLGYPVALKLDGSGILHRTEIDGVRLDLHSAPEVRTAWRELTANALAHGITASSVLVQRMVEGGVELFVGAMRDEQFGPVVMCGAGGVFLELIDDVSVALAPMDLLQAQRMVESTKAFRLLQGWRGAAAADMAALYRNLVAISELAAEPDVEALDINPLIVLDDGVALVDTKLVSR